AFDDAIARERNAVAAWREIVKSAGDVYSDELAFGVHAVGFPRHWKEELGKLEKGLDQLIAQRREKTGEAVSKRAPFTIAPPPRVRLEPVGKAQPSHDLGVAARAEAGPAIKSMRLRYRHLTQFEDYRTVDMSLDRASGLFVANIPGDFITPKWDLIYF